MTSLNCTGPPVGEARSSVVILRIVCLVRPHSRVGELDVLLALLFQPIASSRGLRYVVNARPFPYAANIWASACETRRRTFEIKFLSGKKTTIRRRLRRARHR